MSNQRAPNNYTSRGNLLTDWNEFIKLNRVVVYQPTLQLNTTADVDNPSIHRTAVPDDLFQWATDKSNIFNFIKVCKLRL